MNTARLQSCINTLKASLSQRCLLKKPNEPQVHFDALKEAIRQSNLPMLVDILDWARIPASFQEEIKRNYFLIR